MRADRLEEVSTCALCGSGEKSTLFTEDPFSVVRCSNCGLVYVTPRLPPGVLLEEIYDESYWKSDSPKVRGYADYSAERDFYVRTFRIRNRFVRSFASPPGKVLDVGCAAGFFLAVAREDGWECAGVEPSAPIAETARKNLPGVEIFTGLLEDAPFEKESFDLVTLWDVVEHTPDPVSFLRAAAAMVKPGGVLILETQNVDSLFARILGRKWQHYKHAEHLYHFSPYTLRRLLEKEAGLAVLAMTSRYGGKLVSPAFVAERAGRIHPVLSGLLSPFSAMKRTAFYVNLFDELVAACRKPGGGGAG